MKKTLFVSIFFTLALSPLITNAFEGLGRSGSRQAGMGGAAVMLQDQWAIHNNPAGIAGLRQFGANIGYENRFGMKELSLKSAGMVAPVNFGVFGLSFNQFGYKLYHENKVGLAYARSFGPALRLGLQLDYLSSRFAEGYEGGDHVTFEMGAQYDITKKLSVAALVFNPIGVKRSSLTNERIPMAMRFGLGFHFTESLLATAEIEKYSDAEADAHLGLEYDLHHKFFLRTGVSVNPGVFSFGAGYRLGPLQLDLAGSIHQLIGSRLQASLTYTLGKKAGE